MKPPEIREDHPNPAWARPAWFSLDGLWSISRGGRKSTIRVPFPVGSPASGVDFPDRGHFVYRRSFELPEFSSEKRYLLHIGACDYHSAVLVNGKRVGEHTGGYASFAFDITDAIKSGKNALEIRVRDSHSPFQARGKQTFLPLPFAVWYAGIAGIWQSVWIEETGRRFIERAEVRTDFTAGQLVGSVALNHVGKAASEGLAPERAEPISLDPSGRPPLSLQIEITAPDGALYSFEAAPEKSTDEPDEPDRFSFRIPLASIGDLRWSPETPRLYALHYRLTEGEHELDSVESYFGLRSLAVDKDGLLINGEHVYLRMVLAQGYYPGGVYTPESTDAMERDIRAMLAMGFNGARIHEKVESPYFQYLCDKLGLLTTFEMSSFYLPSRRGFDAYQSELEELIRRDAVHPSCVIRVLFNETWGIWGIYSRRSATRRFVLDMIELCGKLDPDRPIIDNSGWEHLRTDIADFHHYLKTSALAREAYAKIAAGDSNALTRFSVRSVIAFYLRNLIGVPTRALFLEPPRSSRASSFSLSEYGGFGWYKAGERGSAIEDIEQYTRDILESGVFCGYCYTQFCDTGTDVNGLLSADRKPKLDIARLAALNAEKPQKTLAPPSSSI